MIKLIVCLLLTWLCCFVICRDTNPRLRVLRRTRYAWRIRIDGGRVIMAIANTLVMVQTGIPTGACEVRSRENDNGQGQGITGDKQ